MQVKAIVKNQDIILMLKVDRETEKGDRQVLHFLSRLKRGVTSEPFIGDVAYLGLSGLISKCDWINPLTMLESPPSPKMPPQPTGAAPGDVNKRLPVNVHYVTTENRQAQRVGHLVVLPHGFNTKAPDALENAKEANYTTVCGKEIFNNPEYINIMFADGFGGGIPRCTTCIARAEKLL